MVFQNYALYPHMSVADNIGYALKVAGVPKAERRRAGRGDRPLGEPRADISTAARPTSPAASASASPWRRAMIRKPKVFLFDEPLSNLDAQLRVQMRAEIRRLHRQLGTTSVFVTHDQAEAMTLADRLVVMRAGRIEQVGTPAEIYGRPASRFVAGFIGSPPMNLIEGTIESGGVFAQGDRTRIPVPVPGAAEMPGRRVLLGVRPEEITLAEPGAPGSLAATVDFVEELGAGRIVQADLAGAPFAVAITDKRPLNPGDAISLAIPPEAIYLYDDETGARVERWERGRPDTEIGIPIRILCVGEDIAIGLVQRPEHHALGRTFGAEDLDISHLEGQLHCGLPELHGLASSVYEDVCPAIRRYKLNDPILRQPHRLEAEMLPVEVDGLLDIAGVKNDPT